MNPSARRRQWRFALGVSAIAIGVLGGVGLFTLNYAEATSYLSTDPAACVNCHIMQSQYDSWQKASHHIVATCVDCHLPHPFFAKYLAKAEHGWNHSTAFTLMNFPEPIRISKRSAAAVQGNCARCHGELVHAQSGGRDDGLPDCTHCHADVGHGPRAGLGGPLRPRETEPGGSS